MSNNANHDLILKAASLARSSPENWARFMAALAVYSSQQSQNCVQSPLEFLPVAQGRAQACASLLGLLEGCLSSADKIEGKRK